MNKIEKRKNWTYMLRIAQDPAKPEEWLKPKKDEALSFTVDNQEAPYLKPYWQVDTETFTCFPVIEP